MCLFETKMKNPRYLINEKNNGNIPKAEDKRQMYIYTKCGWCVECRKELARNWQIRLTEEIKENKEALFITLSFSPQTIKQLEEEIIKKQWRGINGKEIDVNQLAAYAVRMWSERWRKYTKKAPKHWLITELGHKKSERIHLHGILWGNNKELLEKTWKYGNIYIGKYVSERTMNYITKYITKLDEYHKGYKQKIMCSKGIGKSYIEGINRNTHNYKGKETITYYTTRKGYKLPLPKYYKEKIWNEEQRRKLWSYTLDENTMRINGEVIKKDEITQEELERKLKSARENNDGAGYGNKKTINKKWLITDAMKKTHKEINYKKDKLVQSTNRRIIEKIITSTENEKQLKIINNEIKEKYKTDEKSKANGVERVIYGEYIGTTTERERNYNELLKRAKEMKCSVREIRLIDKGIIKRKKKILEED